MCTDSCGICFISKSKTQGISKRIRHDIWHLFIETKRGIKGRVGNKILLQHRDYGLIKGYQIINDINLIQPEYNFSDLEMDETFAADTEQDDEPIEAEPQDNDLTVDPFILGRCHGICLLRRAQRTKTEKA